ncbi:TIGR04255 family protein [Leeuwenhoekiella aequorea]|uniref:TIGR04255 family protein n=1 Tax=Leeuwenhoekiella aequorea TaxID=283736 RepID=A0A4Q0PBT9_9FLAO|nr:TIGR04255 family protein [Leeuwenhoekiella aequorea]RXG24290.1 putative protein (TIGR04255 family) [Leeuwenhoekiella aequorea]
MSNHSYYENAPIILSILQFRFAPLENLNVNEVKKLASVIKKNFPDVEEKYSQGILINNNQDQTNISLDEKKFEGVQISSKDKKDVFVITRDKFTFQSKNKYLGWESFTENIKLFWDAFSNTHNIEQLNGISLRYVNKFDLPLGLKDFKKYFTTYMEDKKNDFSITNYQFRFSSIDKENNLIVNIGHSLEKATSENIPYIFDLDILKNDFIINNSKSVWEEFEKIREKKNQVFNQSITEETINLIR